MHARVAPGFVVATTLDGDDRIVTFANGAQAREKLVTCDDVQRRLVYAVVESGLGATHHQAAVEVHDDGRPGAGCRLVWTTDVLPDDLAGVLDQSMDAGAAAITRALGG